MKRWGVVFFLLICFPLAYNANAQNISNEGTDFWAVFPTHDPSPSVNQGALREANITIWVTSKFESQVTVTCNGSIVGVANRVIQPNTPLAFEVPRNQAYIRFDEQNQNLTNRGIHVQVSPGKPKVAVYAHIYAGARSAASLILPYESLGQRYFSMNYTQDLDNSRNNRNFMTIVASDDDTDIIIHPKTRSQINVHLDKAGDVYEYMPLNTEDLTGTYVEIDPMSPGNCTKRFAVFSGSTSVTIGCGPSRDPLYQQLYPVTSWGKSYCIVPFKDRRYYFRVLAEEDNTLVNIGNSLSVALNKGMVYTSPMVLTDALFVSANKKISVAEYSLSQDCSGVAGNVLGDPEMVLLNPTEFNIKSITLFSSNLQDISEKYINVSMKTSATATFKINGRRPLGNWTTVPRNPELSYIQIQTFDQGSTLTADEGFNAIAYGFGDYESYAYSAGTNLAANTYMLVNNTDANFDSPNACQNQKSDFKIVLPYKALKIIWQLDDGPPFTGNPNPREFSGPTGDLLYEYVYEKKHIFTVLEKHNMVVRTEKPNTSDCLGSELEYTFTFEVYPLPTTDFESVAEACADYEVNFTDKSDSHIPDRPYNKWLWDFGDGETSTEQNPKHIFREGRVYDVRLRAGLDDGCLDEMVKKISIKPRILTDFKVNPVECIGTEVSVQDLSTVVPAGPVINSWIWDFGDGSPLQRVRAARHIYTAPGSYDIKLIAGTNNGCESLVKSKRIVIKGLPIADFLSPKVCPNDEAVFKNLSTDAELGVAGLTYSWDFGDPESGTENFDTKREGVHKYSKAGNYHVRLVVSTENGCVATVSKELTVNSSFIDAKFTILNENELCSDKKVTLVNTSRIEIGQITKIVIYKDEADPGQVFEDPKFNDTYELEYPAASSPLPQKYLIRMRAYSGVNCFVDAEPQTVTIYPSPKLVFSSLPSICLNGGKVLFTQGKEMLGLTGIPVYGGAGTSVDGTFDPTVAGVGSHMIRYSFKSDKGCVSSETRMITVYPIPMATLPKDVFLYKGEKLRLDLRAEGRSLRFQWMPSINLDRNDIQNPIVTADTERAYTVTITSADGCIVSEEIFVHIIPEIENANAFSPNGDGINDTWVIKNSEIYFNSTVEVFNRYGVKVYSSKGFYRPFDGKYKDIPLPVGTYYYIINPNNGRKIVTGSLTLIR